MDSPVLLSAPNIQLHAEMLVVAFLGLVHLSVVALIFVLGRRRRGGQRGDDNRAAPKLHSIRHTQLANLGKQCDIPDDAPLAGGGS